MKSRQKNPPAAEPLVSIIMPFKNAVDFIGDCLNSITNQSYANWELIAVNDNSTDAGRTVVQQYAANDDRIRLFENPHSGIISALQFGLNKCHGTFVSRMDADDLMPPNRLLKMVQALACASQKTVVTGLVQYFSAEAVSSGYKKYEHWLNLVQLTQSHRENIYRECVVASPNWIMRREESLAMGGFANLNYPEDYHLAFKWYQHNFHFKVIPEITLLWREHPKRTSRNSEHYQQEAFFKMKIEQFVQNELNGTPLVLWGTGRKGKLSAAYLKALKIDFHWMAVKPQQYPKGIYGHKVESFKKILELPQKKILLAVYPPERERARLRSFLENENLQEGLDFWFL